MPVHLPMARPLPLLLLLGGLAGCPPYITPARHAQDVTPSGLVRTDIAGALSACEGVQGGTAYFIGDWSIDPKKGTVDGIDQIAIFANSAWQAAGGVDCWYTFAVGGSASGDLGSQVQLDVTDDWLPDDNACSRDDFFVQASSENTWVGQVSGGQLTLQTSNGDTFVSGQLSGKDFSYATQGFCVRRHLGTSATASNGEPGVIGPTQSSP